MSLFIEIEGESRPKLVGSGQGSIVTKPNGEVFRLKLSYRHKGKDIHDAILEVIYLRIFALFGVAPSAYLTLVTEDQAIKMIADKFPDVIINGEFNPIYKPRLKAARFGDKYLCSCTSEVEDALTKVELIDYIKKHAMIPTHFDNKPIEGLGVVLALSHVFKLVDWLGDSADNTLFQPKWNEFKRIYRYIPYIVDIGSYHDLLHRDEINFNFGVTIPLVIDIHLLPNGFKREYVKTLERLQTFDLRVIISDIIKSVRMKELEVSATEKTFSRLPDSIYANERSRDKVLLRCLTHIYNNLNKCYRNIKGQEPNHSDDWNSLVRLRK